MVLLSAGEEQALVFRVDLCERNIFAAHRECRLTFPNRQADQYPRCSKAISITVSPAGARQKLKLRRWGPRTVEPETVTLPRLSGRFRDLLRPRRALHNARRLLRRPYPTKGRSPTWRDRHLPYPRFRRRQPGRMAVRTASRFAIGKPVIPSAAKTALDEAGIPSVVLPVRHANCDWVVYRLRIRAQVTRGDTVGQVREEIFRMR